MFKALRSCGNAAGSNPSCCDVNAVAYMRSTRRTEAQYLSSYQSHNKHTRSEIFELRAECNPATAAVSELETTALDNPCPLFAPSRRFAMYCFEMRIRVRSGRISADTISGQTIVVKLQQNID